MSGLTGKKPAAAPRLTRRDLPPEESYGSGSRGAICSGPGRRRVPVRPGGELSM